MKEISRFLCRQSLSTARPHFQDLLQRLDEFCVLACLSFHDCGFSSCTVPIYHSVDEDEYL
ncbi:hypothetical protein PILCRDRAFT_321158 [Piloderma croceum F 1598]|uniref:Uncharacterized protein n=1 Tax=Piloderma croceum (strain F 1598) TaxID=765440 RepID=A0A0C3C987_PILCF|nr:hypothetical protein PILCRDRAFT_321158 [Piloderma croceum F 1598]